MPKYFFDLIKFSTIAAITVLFTACGGGGGADGGSESQNEGHVSSFSSSTNAATDGTSGQALYAAYCTSCHGASYSPAKNYASTLSAIARNKGGMGYLTNIQTSQANDIATYLTYGAPASSANPTLSTQTITFASPGNQTLGTTTAALTASSSSGLSVTMTSSTPAVCSVSGTAITLLASGTCNLTASQIGDASFAAASPVTRSFSVAAAPGLAQTISFTSPGQQTIDVGVLPLITTSLVAMASSNLPVTFSSVTPSICAVSGSTLTLRLPGTCSITVNQAGDATYATATTVSYAFNVVASIAAAGKAAYKQVINGQSCASCHGVPGSQPTSLILNAANKDLVLSNAIINNIGGMGVLNDGRYTPQQIRDIAAYLATPGI
jgi:mono/diheme cytochrome c family protein